MGPDLAACAGTWVGVALADQVADNTAIGIVSAALVKEGTVPLEPERFERRKNLRRGAGLFPGRVNVLYPDQPLAMG